jgi:hypothetical protein
MRVAMDKIRHAADPIPPQATRDQRVRWRAAHAQARAYRPVPANFEKEVERFLATRPHLAKLT